jgi:AraC-like DNA-binding protein
MGKLRNDRSNCAERLVDSDLVASFAEACQVALGKYPNDHRRAVTQLCRVLGSRIPTTRSFLAEHVMRNVVLRLVVRAVANWTPAHERQYLWPLVVHMASGTGWNRALERFLVAVRLLLDSPADYTNIGDRRVIRVIELIEARCAESLRLSGIAAEVHVSSWYLSKMLKKNIGVGFSGLIRLIRIKKAEVLLESSMLSVKEVAASVGYSGTAAFDRDFRRVHGLTPSEWRISHASTRDYPSIDCKVEGENKKRASNYPIL